MPLAVLYTFFPEGFSKSSKKNKMSNRNSNQKPFLLSTIVELIDRITHNAWHQINAWGVQSTHEGSSSTTRVKTH